MAFKTKPIDFRLPRRLKEWLNGLRDDAESSQATAGIGTTITETGKGRAVNVSNLRTLELDVCIAGETKTVVFYVQGGPFD